MSVDEQDNEVDLENLLNLSDAEFAEREAEIKKSIAEISTNDIEEEEEEESSDSGYTDPTETIQEKFTSTEEEEEGSEDVFEEESPLVQETKDKKSEAETQADPDSFYEIVTNKFRASGKEYQITDPNQVVALMQKGIDYSKKMEAMKPALKAYQVLQDAGISYEDLGLLVDVHTGKAEAIAKLIKDKKLDYFELDDSKAEEYAPEARPEITDQQIELNLIAKEYEGVKAFDKAVEEVLEWDEPSRKFIVENPNSLRLLTEHIETGMYDQIMQKIAEHQSSGNVQEGVTMLQMYNYFGNQLYGNSKPARKKTVTSKRRAVSGHRGGTSKANSLSSSDLLSMSDEEFRKLRGV